MKQLLLYTTFLLALGVPNHLSSQLSSNATISILTCRSGDSIDNMFGHTAIRIVDPATQKDEIFNFGIFSFEEPNFTMKFMRGKLLYSLGRSSFNRFLSTYHRQKRSVFQQQLDLDHSQVNAIYNSLLENYKPENRRYKYDFFFDNCSTRARDLFPNNLEGIRFPDEPEKTMTYRDLLDQHTYRWPWTDFGMDLLVGHIADRTATVKDQMYLPEFFFDHLENMRLGNKPLVNATTMVLDHESAESERDRTPWISPLLFFGVLLILEIFLFFKNTTNRAIRFYDKMWFLVTGVGGLLILFMWFGTDHITTKGNLNLLWMSPLFLFRSFSSKRTVDFLLLLMLGMTLLLASFVQQLHAATILIIILLIFKLIRVVRDKEKA